MSYPPPKRSVPASSEEPDADFNWPPTDGELAQYGIKTPASPVPSADPVVLPETLAQPPAPAIAQAATPPSSSEPRDAEFDCTVLDGASPGEWVAEIARLQELIEGLTQKLEWRIKSVGR